MMTDVWTPIAYETREWISRSTDIPRRREAIYSGSYQAAIPLEIAPCTAIPVRAAIAADIDEVSVEIARFDSLVGADLLPFTSLLLRSESAASSTIENLTSSAKAVALAELGDRSGRNARIIVANARTMTAALLLADHLDEQAILDMHAALLDESAPEITGRWRDQPVWIGGTQYGPHEAMFVPPHHSRVPGAMADLLAYIHRDDVPTLLLAVIAHAQFETIHPFPDGNGRTGRALIHSILRARRLTRQITVPISAGLLANIDSYFAGLTAYRLGDVEPLTIAAIDAAWSALNNGRQLVEEIHAIRDGWSARIRQRSGAAAWKIAELLPRQPAIDTALVERETGLAMPNINRGIEHLVELDILRAVNSDRRNRRWTAIEITAALDAFAQRSGRRQIPRT